MAVIRFGGYFSASSDASAIDDDVRSLKSDFAAGIGEFAYGPSSASSQGASTSSTGELLPGAGRFAEITDARSNTTGNTSGWLVEDTSTVLMHHAGSTATVALGGQRVDEAVSSENEDTFRWVVSTGTEVFSFGGVSVITTTFPTPYNSRPFVYMQLETDGNAGAERPLAGIEQINTSQFVSVISNLGTATGANWTIQWMSEGTIDF